jgi:hypothetical protein
LEIVSRFYYFRKNQLQVSGKYESTYVKSEFQWSENMLNSISLPDRVAQFLAPQTIPWELRLAEAKRPIPDQHVRVADDRLGCYVAAFFQEGERCLSNLVAILKNEAQAESVVDVPTAMIVFKDQATDLVSSIVADLNTVASIVKCDLWK